MFGENTFFCMLVTHKHKGVLHLGLVSSLEEVGNNNGTSKIKMLFIILCEM